MGAHTRVGHRIVGTIKKVKGHCHAGHKTGQQFDLDVHDVSGVCGYLFHDALPYLVMLQFGGGFPSGWGDPDVVEVECPDKKNAVTIELKRIRETDAS